MIINNNFIVQNIKPDHTQNVQKEHLQNKDTADFIKILDTKIGQSQNRNIQFSKHAECRLKSREIALSGEQLKRLEDGVDRAKEKGIKDSLVIVDNVALLVNVTNKTVITCMSGQDNEDKVFTNIDGAVIV